MGLFFKALEKHKKETSTSPTESNAVTTGASMNAINKNLVSINKPHSMEAELFRVLRARILFPVSGKPPKSILVTSAVPGDGKSFVASNLAVNLAQNIDETVLLVDCDLRKPVIHKNFGFNSVKGLSEHLTNNTKVDHLFLKTVVDKLTLLPAGKPPANPSEILSSAKMADLVKELKSRYDDRYLIIDTPPPLIAPETSAIAKLVDGIIVVIKCGSTPLDLFEEMISNLGKRKIIGAVFNQYDMPSSSYYGYGKYRKYYKKYYKKSS
jgi:protein-tyrosine kinase